MQYSLNQRQKLHANVWPGVLAALGRHGIGYSIHYYPPLRLLVATFKYTGDDCAKDMAAIGKDEETRRWWS
jgi:L-rhamnose mutarotase